MSVRSSVTFVAYDKTIIPMEIMKRLSESLSILLLFSAKTTSLHAVMRFKTGAKGTTPQSVFRHVNYQSLLLMGMINVEL
jgi:hypothetical protein